MLLRPAIWLVARAATWVAATGDQAHGYYDHDSGASERLVVELGTPVTVYSILSGPNVDLSGPDPAAPGPWLDWAQCKLKQREFPLDWSQVSTVEVDF